MTDKQPSYVIPENVSRTIGKDAQRNNILAAKIVADIVKSTLGPKGMDKMLVNSNGDIIVTNDGVTILEEMEIDHPAAKMMVEIAKTQESEVGDGTTSAALLAGKLLENAEKLLDRHIHPTLIIKGYKLASDKVLEYLNSLALPVHNKSVLKQIAMTAMTGKGAEGNKEFLADLIISAVDAVSLDNRFSKDDIFIQKIKGDHVGKSELIMGIAIEKERANIAMPSQVEQAKILLIDFPLEIKNPETEARISVSSPEQLDKFIEFEEQQLVDMTRKIIDSTANVVFCQKGIDDVAQYYLAKAGIFACRRVTRSEMERISRATSAKIISNIKDVNSRMIGDAAIVSERKHGEQNFVFISGCKNPRSVTLLIKGGSIHSLDELERALNDGLGDIVAALKSGKVVAGGGAVEMELSKRLKAYAHTLGGREQLAVEEFASTLESIPQTLAENAGLDPIEVVTELRKRHESGLIRDGLNLFKDNIEDCFAAGIIEPLKVKTQAISSAAEFAMMILRIDDVLVSSQNEKNRDTNTYEGMD